MSDIDSVSGKKGSIALASEILITWKKSVL